MTTTTETRWVCGRENHDELDNYCRRCGKPRPAPADGMTERERLADQLDMATTTAWDGSNSASARSEWRSLLPTYRERCMRSLDAVEALLTPSIAAQARREAFEEVLREVNATDPDKWTADMGRVRNYLWNQIDVCQPTAPEPSKPDPTPFGGTRLCPACRKIGDGCTCPRPAEPPPTETPALDAVGKPGNRWLRKTDVPTFDRVWQAQQAVKVMRKLRQRIAELEGARLVELTNEELRAVIEAVDADPGVTAEMGAIVHAVNVAIVQAMRDKAKRRRSSIMGSPVFRAILNSDGLAKNQQHERARDCIEAERAAKEATCSTK